MSSWGVQRGLQPHGHGAPTAGRGPCWDGPGAAGVGGSASTSRTSFFSVVSGQQRAKCPVRWVWGLCIHTCTHINMHRLTDRALQTHTHIYLCAPGIPLLEGNDVQCVLVLSHPNSCALQNLVLGGHLDFYFRTVLGCCASILSFLFLL